jgi:selenocysteine lyase/cysteine desulfurase
MTGTQNHACIAGVTAAVEYIASLANDMVTRPETRSRLELLDMAFEWIEKIETKLIERLIAGLQRIRGVRIYGITDSQRFKYRAPTVSFSMDRFDSVAVATKLGRVGVCAWHGNYYALPLTLALGTEPQGMVRLGCMHYNTLEEVDYTLEEISKIAAQS